MSSLPARIINGVLGGFMLLGFNLNGMNRLQFGTENFLRSFGAALLVLPLQLILIDAQYANVASEIALSKSSMRAIELIGYGLVWVAYPLALIPVARLLGHSQRYVPYIIAYNWGSVATYAIMVPAYSLMIANPEGAAVLVAGTAGVWSLAFRIWLARKVLGADLPQSIALMLIDGGIALLLSIALATIALPATS